jgi:hypothetical protein
MQFTLLNFTDYFSKELSVKGLVDKEERKGQRKRERIKRRVKR